MTILEVLLSLSILIGLVGSILKILADRTQNEGLRRKLEDAEAVVGAIGKAVNDATPLLGVDRARKLKNAAVGHARVAGVAGALEDLVVRHRLNERSTSELANPLL